ncbi:MAG: MBL fold metallo-hydrolase, partial [Thermomicrobiaceae bacterium]|nr:MBL fold metallo-hydrolase [Thermomicrobiaceae bacterium]
PQVLRDHRCPILGTEGTLASIEASPSWSWERLTPHRPVEIGDLRVRPIPVPHDAAEPVGFVVEDHECRVAIFTDLGHVPDGLDVVIQGADLVVFEANYDERMLASGRYPAHLKRRIRGPRGHLSNDACGAFLARTLTSSTTDVWLAHLSQNNNRPAVALGAVRGHLSSLPVRCAVTPLPRRGATTTWDSRVARERPRQLTLGIQP